MSKKNARLRFTRISQRVEKALRAVEAKDIPEALLHACIAVAATARREDRGLTDRRAFETFLMKNMDLIVLGMTAGAFTVASLEFEVPSSARTLGKRDTVGLETILYKLVRCSLIHEDDLPSEVEFTEANDPKAWQMSGQGRIVLPWQVVWGLVLSVVGAPANSLEVGCDNWYIGDKPVADLWGRKAVIMDCFGGKTAQRCGKLTIHGTLKSK